MARRRRAQYLSTPKLLGLQAALAVGASVAVPALLLTTHVSRGLPIGVAAASQPPVGYAFDASREHGAHAAARASVVSPSILVLPTAVTSPAFVSETRRDAAPSPRIEIGARIARGGPPPVVGHVPVRPTVEPTPKPGPLPVPATPKPEPTPTPAPGPPTPEPGPAPNPAPTTVPAPPATTTASSVTEPTATPTVARLAASVPATPVPASPSGSSDKAGRDQGQASHGDAKSQEKAAREQAKAEDRAAREQTKADRKAAHDDAKAAKNAQPVQAAATPPSTQTQPAANGGDATVQPGPAALGATADTPSAQTIPPPAPIAQVQSANAPGQAATSAAHDEGQDGKKANDATAANVGPPGHDKAPHDGGPPSGDDVHGKGKGR